MNEKDLYDRVDKEDLQLRRVRKRLIIYGVFVALFCIIILFLLVINELVIQYFYFLSSSYP